MAQGDLTLFNQFTQDLAYGVHDMDADTFKFALCTNSTVPTAATAVPHFGGTGTTDFSATECSGSGYTAGGIDVTAAVQALAGAATAIDGTTNPSWTQTAGGPTDIRWGIIYNDTDTSKRCVGFAQMTSGADASLVDGDVSFTFAAGGIFTLTRV